MSTQVSTCSSSGRIVDAFCSSAVPGRNKRGYVAPKSDSGKKNAESRLKILYKFFEVNQEEYRLTHLTKKERKAREWGHWGLNPTRVAFYYVLFEAGLRLPLDPFICEFLECMDVVPMQIGANSVRVLISFVMVCRFIGYEPCMKVFREFFKVVLDKKTLGISTPARAKAPKFFVNLPDKAIGWNSHLILAEIRSGWEFPLPNDESRKLKEEEYWAPDWSKELSDRLYLVASKGPISWELLGSNKNNFIQAGMLLGGDGDVVPLALIVRSPRYPDWVTHSLGRFEDQCHFCQNTPNYCRINGEHAGGTLRAATSGQAFPQYVFDHWDMMSSDPLEAGSQACTLGSTICKRKVLKETITPLSQFEDKLQNLY